MARCPRVAARTCSTLQPSLTILLPHFTHHLGFPSQFTNMSTPRAMKFAAVPDELGLLEQAVLINVLPITLLNAGRILRIVWQAQGIQWAVSLYSYNDYFPMTFEAPANKLLFSQNGVVHHALVEKEIPVAPFMTRNTPSSYRRPPFIDPARCMAAIQYSIAFDQALQLAPKAQPPVANLDWTFGGHNWGCSWVPVTFPAVCFVTSQL